MALTDQESNPASTRFTLDIDKLIHEPSRLIILSYLYVVKNADLIFFKRKTNLSWGNLSSHAAKLEEAGYIRIEKTFRNKKPVTILEITDEGRKAFDAYKNTMKEVLGE
ncbi:MAG: winged helix-turn-helix domain-containing protein [Candidatus Odinarchaeota archaeon]